MKMTLQKRKEKKKIRKLTSRYIEEILRTKGYIGETIEGWMGDDRDYKITSKVVREYHGEEDGLALVIIKTEREAVQQEKHKEFVLVDLRKKEVYKLDSFYSLGSGDLAYGKFASFKPISFKREGDDISVCYSVTYWDPSESILPKREVNIKTIRGE